MRRCVMLCLTLVTMSACTGDRVVEPTISLKSPTNDISDAMHTAPGITSNPDFFFLPPMVKDPSASPVWNAGAFNGNLAPRVSICELQAPDELSVTATTPCLNAVSYAATVSLTDELYKVNWTVPVSGTVFYRINVLVGRTRLGFADVETGANGSQLKNVDTREFVPLVDGRTLPIKFRIERYALCANPLLGGCTSASGDIATTPLTVSTGTPTTDASGISTTQGITIPAQGGSIEPVTVTVASCPALNRDDLPVRLAVIDLPTFGDCVRVTFDPKQRLTTPATVFVCAVGVGASLFVDPATLQPLLGADQEARVTMFRYDDAGVAALPHADACKPGTPGGVLASAKPSIGAMLADLGRGQFRRAASKAAALMAPKPLYAARFIDLGGGGLTDENSDFQFALPAKMEIVASTNNQTAAPGSTLSPTVLVTDLAGAPVRGAVVHFFTSDPALLGGTSVTTGANGLASTSWTIVEGSNSLPASGRGIASPTDNGPRTGADDFDPFQPIAGTTSAVTAHTGAVTFFATGQKPTEIAIYKNYNAWFGENKDEGVLQSAPFNFIAGTHYFVRPMSQLQAGIPATTTLIIITSASQGDLLNQVSQERAGITNLDAWVRAGGLLVMHSGDNANPGYLVPGLSGEVGGTNNCTGLTLTVTDHALIRGPDAVLGTADDLTDANIDNGGRFCYDNHGSLAGLTPPGAQILIREQGGEQRPVYATYALGRGRVIVTTLTLEFRAHSRQTLVNHFYWAINGPNAPAASLALTPFLAPLRSVGEEAVTVNSDGSPRP